jgi:hypothetical protein
VATDSAGELYIGDTENNRIRKVSNGVIATVAGDGACCYSGDNGPATSAELNNPAGVAVDAAGKLYVADLYNDRVRVLTPSGISCSASVAPLTFTAASSGGNLSVAIQAGASCAWAVQGLPDWIAFAGSTVGTGAGSVTLTVSVNLSGPRTAVISIAGAWITVNQAGATVAPAPLLVLPANGAIGVSSTPVLTWSASAGATSYDVYFGAASAPPLVTNTARLSFSPSTLNAGTTYFWAIAARNGIGATTSDIWSFTTSCASPLNPAGATAGVSGGEGSAPVTATTACGWTAVSNAPWITITSGASGGYLNWITDEYSTMTPFNSDNSNILLVHQSYFGLYNGSGSYIQDLPLEINSSSEPRWSRSDNHTVYYVHGNQLKSYDISSGAMSVVHTFSEYSAISGFGESDISLDGDHFVFAGNSEFIFVYQISTDAKLPVFDAGSQPFDSLYITPDNNVIVSWLTAGSARYTGQELFDTSMTFLRQVGHADGHKDVTSDTNGDEVLIWTNSGDPNPIANCNNGIVKIRLADATQTCLLQLDWSLAVNISGPDHSGFVYVDTYAPSNPTPPSGWAAYTNELLQVKLDGSQALRLAHHRSRPNPGNTYNWEPRISTSRDGSRVVYNSDYDLPAIDGYADEYSDAYLIVVSNSPTGLVGGGLEFPPDYNTFQPPAVGGAYADPVFGSTVKRISNALGTLDAGDSGDGTVVYSVAANPGAQRTGTITIAGQTFTVTQAASPTPGYLVGDVAPYMSDTEPNFGDGAVNILDLIQELFGVDNIPGFRPAACSDRYDAMDTYPPDTATTRGGDGVLDVRDLTLELFRVNNLNLSRPIRTSLGGVCRGSSGNSMSPTEVSRRSAAPPKPQAAVQGALVLGTPEQSAAAEEQIPVYVEAGRDLVRVAVTFALGDQQSRLSFVSTAKTPPSLVQDSQVGVVAAAWLDGVSVPAGGRLLLGYVAGPAVVLANLKVYGVSASGLDDNREVRLDAPAGAGPRQ